MAPDNCRPYFAGGPLILRISDPFHLSLRRPCRYFRWTRILIVDHRYLSRVFRRTQHGGKGRRTRDENGSEMRKDQRTRQRSKAGSYLAPWLSQYRPVTRSTEDRTLYGILTAVAQMRSIAVEPSLLFFDSFGSTEYRLLKGRI